MSKAFKIIEKSKNYLILRSKDENINKYSPAVVALGGTAFDTGNISDDSRTEYHNATCEVLSEWGLDTNEDVIIILDSDWVKKIKQEIEDRI